MSAISKQALIVELRGQARRASSAQDWIAAGAAWTQVLDHLPLDFEALFRVGQATFFQDDLDSAATQINAALNLNPTHAESLRLYARIAHRHRDWGAAEHRWGRLLAVAAGDFEGHFRRAQALQSLGFYDEVVADLEAALALKPQNAELIRLKAENLEKRREPADAIQWWQKVLSANSKDLDGWLRLARLHVLMGDYSAAETDIEQIVTLLSGPGAPQGADREKVSDQLRRLGRDLYANAAWVAAELIWRHLVAEAPDNGDWQFRLGLVLSGLGNSADAVRAFDKAQSLLPERADIARWADRLRREAELETQIIGRIGDDDGYKSDDVSFKSNDGSDKGGDDSTAVAPVIQSDAAAEASTTSQDTTLANPQEEAGPLPIAEDRITDPLLFVRAAAKAAESQENWWQAVTHWNELLAETPDDIQAMAGKVRALRGLRHYDRAEIALRALIAQAPDAPETAALTAQINDMAQLATTATAQAQLLLADARRLTNSRQWEAALAIWDKLLIFRETLEVCYRRAQCLQHLTRLEEAEASIRRAQEHRANHVGVLVTMGRILAGRRKWQEAAEIWAQVIELEADGFEQYFRLGQCQLQIDSLVDAERTLTHAITMRPGHYDCLHTYLTVMGRLGKQAEGRQLIRELAGRDADGALIVINMARHLAAAGAPEEALSELDASLQAYPHHQELRINQSRILLQMERWAEVVSLLAPLAAANADNPRPELALIGVNLSLAYDRLDQLDGMEQACLFALRCEPGNGTAMTRLARLWRTQGKIVAALEMRERYCEAYPTDGQGWEERIFLTASLERESQARLLMAEANRRMAQTGTSAWHIARGAEAGVMLPEATTYYELAAQRDPAFHIHAAAFFRRNGQMDRALPHALAARRHVPADAGAAQHLIAAIRGLELLDMDWRTVAETPIEQPVLFPEDLYGLLVQRLTERPRHYVPQRRGIALVTGSLAPGGAERQLVTTIRGIVESGHALGDITLYCVSLQKRLRRDFYLPLIADLPINIVELDAAAADQARAQLSDDDLALVRHFPDDMRPAIQFWYADFMARRPAVVHAWQDSTCLTAVVAALLAGVPRIVLSTRSTRPDNPRRRLKRYMERAYRQVMPLPNVVMLNNSRAGATDYEEWLDLPPQTVEVIYNGIDFDALAAQADPAETARLRAEHGIPADAPVLGGVFRMSEEKRPLLWIDSAAAVAKAMPDVHFVVCGDGPMRDEMQLRAQKHGIADRLHMPGQVKVGSWFLMMDVLLLTSRMEGLPNVLLEAQSLGVPVVAPRVGGVPEVVEEGQTGFSVPDADAASLAEKLLFILRDREWHGRAAQRAQIFAKNMFGIRAMTGRTLVAYFPDDTELHPRQPATPDECRRSALAAEAAKDWDKADPIWAELLQLVPGDVQATERRAMIAMHRNDWELAATLLRLAMEQQPGKPELRRQWARCLGKLGQPAIDAWRALLEQLPQDFEGHLCLAQALAEAGDAAQAAVAARNALRARPGHAEPVRVLARLAHRANGGATILHHWDGLLSVAPDDFEALMRSGVACLEQGRYADGEERLLRAVNLHNADPRALEPLVRHLMFQGNLTAARRAILFGLRRRTRDAETWRLLFDMLLITDQTAVIDRVLRRLSVRLSGTQADRLFHARLLLLAERPAQAQAALACLETSGDAAALDLRVDLALRNGDADSIAALAMAGGFRQASPATKRAVRDCRTFLSNMPAPHPDATIVDRFVAALPAALARSSYQPIPGAILHLVNSLAPGGTERQAAITATAQATGLTAADVTLVRTDRGTGGRAVHFAPLLATAGVKTATLAELVANLPGTDDPALLSQITGCVAGHLGIQHIRDIWRLIRDQRPMVIHAWTPQIAVHAAIAGLLTGTPRIVLRAGSVAPGHRTALMPGEAAQFARLRVLYRFIASQPSVVLANNCQANLDSYLQWLGLGATDLPNAPVIIHNAVAADRLSPVDDNAVTALRRGYGIPDGAPVIGSVLRLEKEKGLDLWLNVAAATLRRRPDAHFLLVGDGRMRTDVERLARRLGVRDRLHLAGTVGNDLSRHYRAMDLMLLTSQFEGLPNAVIEAQYCGVPVISRAVGGVGEAMIDGRTGILVTGDRPDAYADILADLLADPARRQLFAATARTHAEARFSTLAMLTDTLRAYGVPVPAAAGT